MTAYQPKTGQPCTRKRGVERDNCPQCEGTGARIDFAAIRARSTGPKSLPAPVKYSEHYFPHSEGHLYFDVDGPCTITLTGAAALSQDALNVTGERIVRAYNAHDDLLAALIDAREELSRIAINQQGISEEDLTDIAQPDITVICRADFAIAKAKGGT